MSPLIHALPNGVRVVVDPMAGLQSCALCVVVRGGARWEAPERSGWSHLLEHMVFKGAGGRSAREIAEAIEAEGGHINAATGYERTSFQVRCLPEALPLAMSLLADLVRDPTLDPQELEREKDVIAQELAEATDTPDDRVFDLAQGQAFAGQALGRPILGSDASLKPATRETLARFHRGLYAADRLVVSAAGAVDPEAILRLADAAFGDMTREADPLPEPAPAVFVGGGVAETRKLEQAHTVLLFPGVSVRDPDYFATRLFVEILGGGMASRLFQVVREERGLAYAIDAYAEHYEDIGLVGVYAGTAGRQTRKAAALAVETARALAEAPSEGELARAKAQTRASLFMGRESPLARAEQAAAQVLLFGRVLDPREMAEALAAVSLEDLRRVGARAFGQRPRTGPWAGAVLGPKAAADALAALG